MPTPSLAYLYSRYPVVSQTFCDSEMLAMEALGRPLAIASLYPPKDSFRHERLSLLKASIHYPPPPSVLKGLQAAAEKDGSWPREMIERHDRDYGPSFQSAVRARNALWFARLFQRVGVGHVHVHFANRATHTALFIKAIAGIPFSFTPHAQDFMVDLGSDALLAEMCAEAAAVIAVSDYSLGLLKERCPESAGKMHRVYNGIRVEDFPLSRPSPGSPLRILSVGRLIEFKGFHHLIEAMAVLRDQGCPANLRIVGDGPWRGQLERMIRELRLEDHVRLLGVRSQEEIKRELETSDVFALACTVDGKGATDILPTVITEAMACGLPVVSTRLAGVPEMVDDGVTGMLAEPGDIQGLAAHLASIKAHPYWARQLGEAGRARAEKLFSLAVTAPSLSGILSDSGCPVPAGGPALETRTLWILPSWPVATELAVEMEWARARGHAFLALDAGPQPGADAALADFLPDGIVLEAAWKANPGAAAQAEALRHELGTAVNGEWFFQLARRAVWLADEAIKRGWNGFHGARAEETVLAWLVSVFSHLPFSGTLPPDHALDGKLVQRLTDAARFLADGSKDDPLGLRAPVSSTRKFGPLALKSPAPPAPDAGKRHQALDRLFAAS